MPRTTESRTITVTTTSASTAITAPAATFDTTDAGRTITGTGIPAAATIATVTSSTAATLSTNATASGTVTATIGAVPPAVLGFTGWSPTSGAEAGAYTVAAVIANPVTPDVMLSNITERVDRTRGRG